jgi:hypothetical protein
VESDGQNGATAAGEKDELLQMRSLSAGNLPPVVPWAEPVDGNKLLHELRQLVEEFVVLPRWAAEVLALWIVHTYVFELRQVAAYLGIESPERRCGKTTLMSLLSELVNRPEPATNQSISTAPPDNTVDTATLSSSLLVNGTNIVAVEIHQHDTGSSDISFDFQLLANPAPPSAGPPSIYWSQFDRTNAVLGWSDPTYVIERANSLPGTYANPASLSPITVHRTNEQGYFRLRR